MWRRVERRKSRVRKSEGVYQLVSTYIHSLYVAAKRVPVLMIHKVEKAEGGLIYVKRFQRCVGVLRSGGKEVLSQATAIAMRGIMWVSVEQLY